MCSNKIFNFFKQNSETSCLFNDDSFKKILPKNTENELDIVCKRPIEICKNPQFIVKDLCFNDLDQGNLGSCWVLAPIINMCLMKNRNLLYYILDPTQTVEKPKYTGKFIFYFGEINNKIMVEIDDYLPVDKNTNTLIFCKNKYEPNEFWAALLEKAFAKYLCIVKDEKTYSYNLLNRGGDPGEATKLLTGGNNYTVLFDDYKSYNEKENKLRKTLNKFKNKIALCIVGKIDENSNNNILDNNIITNHAYSILDYNDEKKILKIKNPWNNKYEFKNQLLNYDSDLTNGIFWVNSENFLSNFNLLQITNLNGNNNTIFINNFLEKSFININLFITKFFIINKSNINVSLSLDNIIQAQYKYFLFVFKINNKMDDSLIVSYDFLDGNNKKIIKNTREEYKNNINIFFCKDKNVYKYYFNLFIHNNKNLNIEYDVKIEMYYIKC